MGFALQLILKPLCLFDTLSFDIGYEKVKQYAFYTAV
jgi:hypothetical protein